MMTPLLARAAMCRVAVLAACALVACELVATTATADDVRVDIGSRLTLARLLDLAAQQAGVSVDYAFLRPRSKSDRVRYRRAAA